MRQVIEILKRKYKFTDEEIDITISKVYKEVYELCVIKDGMQSICVPVDLMYMGVFKSRLAGFDVINPIVVFKLNKTIIDYHANKFVWTINDIS